MIPFSVLDLVPIKEGSQAGESFHNMLDLAQHCEKLGFHRYWLAEHHGMPSIASAATAVLIGQVGRVTQTIRIGAGGIMLPNHSPLVIAEQFGTLESLFPGRIDLGLGRAPGSDQAVARALRRTLASDPDEFPHDVRELMAYFADSAREASVIAVPGAGLTIPIWILGSSLFGAQLAAKMGLPYAFASHFAPAMLMQALTVYRATFQPSEQLDKPYVMLGFNAFAAETDEEAAFHASSMQQSFINLRTGKRKLLPPPVKDYLQQLSWPEQNMLEQVLSCSAIGSPSTVEAQLNHFIELTQPDELMITCQMFDHAARRRSFEIVADLRKNLIAKPWMPEQADPAQAGVLRTLTDMLSPRSKG